MSEDLLSVGLISKSPNNGLLAGCVIKQMRRSVMFISEIRGFPQGHDMEYQGVLAIHCEAS